VVLRGRAGSVLLAHRIARPLVIVIVVAPVGSATSPCLDGTG
jgi:hypothetical protein